MYLVYCMETKGHNISYIFVLEMYVQIMSLYVLLCNVCVCYVYILKMSKKNKSEKKSTMTRCRRTAGWV